MKWNHIEANQSRFNEGCRLLKGIEGLKVVLKLVDKIRINRGSEMKRDSKDNWKDVKDRKDHRRIERII